MKPDVKPATEARTGNGNGQAWVNVLGDMPGAIRLQTEALLAEQADLVGGLQALMAARMQRCHNGAEAAFKTFERICASQNGADALVAYNEWLVGSMGFFMADVTAMQEQATRMTQMGQRTLSAFAAA